MKSNFLTVKINCTPVVKSFLQNNFGNPVSIPEEHVLYKLAQSQLVKTNNRPDVFKDYENSIELNISYRNFKHDGFNINPANTTLFNNAVDNYIKIFCRSNLDSMLLSYDKQVDWKKKCFELLDQVNKKHSDKAALELIKKLKAEMDEHEINIKKAIDIVVCEYLKIDLSVLNYEAVKKDYYRYRLKKFSTQMSSNIN